MNEMRKAHHPLNRHTTKMKKQFDVCAASVNWHPVIKSTSCFQLNLFDVSETERMNFLNCAIDSSERRHLIEIQHEWKDHTHL